MIERVSAQLLARTDATQIRAADLGGLADCIGEGIAPGDAFMTKSNDHVAISRLTRPVAILSALLGVGFAATSAIPAMAQAPGLSGSWSGHGTMKFPSGNSEKAQCRVRYSQTTITRFKATAICATSSARVEQTATLRRVGDNRYIGTFYNSEYGVSGSISVVLRGRVQSVSLNGENGATASLRLSR